MKSNKNLAVVATGMTLVARLLEQLDEHGVSVTHLQRLVGDNGSYMESVVEAILKPERDHEEKVA